VGDELSDEAQIYSSHETHFMQLASSFPRRHVGSPKMFIHTKRRDYKQMARTSRLEASLFWIALLDHDLKGEERNEHVGG